MTQETPGTQTPNPDTSNSKTNWTMIAIVAGIIIVGILIVFGVMNRSGNNEADEASTPAPTEVATQAPVSAARLTIVEPQIDAVVDPSGPITVRGTGEGLPEGNVVVEALDSAGNVLATTPTTIVASDAGVGGEGPWTAQLTVDVAPGTAGTIRAFSPSPADNSILAEVAINVTYGVAPPPVGPLITIEIPLPGEIISAEEVVVVGTGTALPENNVIVRALDANGAILAEQATTVEADLGATGEWRAMLRYSVVPGTLGQVSAFSLSPADGSVIAAASNNVQYGTAAAPVPAITITAPQQGEVVDPAQIVVNGTGTALPENNVVVRALDANGAVLAEQATIASAELGGSGPWSVTLAVNVPGGTPGRIDAFSTSPADGSIMAQSVVDVIFGQPTAAQPAIVITAPAQDQVVDPAQIVVNGTGTALPENNVVVRALDANGTVLAEQATIASAELGGSGPWSVTLAVNVPGGTPGRIDAFSTSPADGSILAQSAVDVVYGQPAAAQPAIVITAPAQDQVVDPAQITVTGTGTALPENNVVVRALDADGAVLAEQPTTVDAELGGSGPWSVTLSVEVSEETQGRIDAFSTSPADGSVVAQTAVDIVYGRGRD